MYTIAIRDLTCEAIIGILPQEREHPQRVVATCEIAYRRSGEEAFVDYAEVSALITAMLQEERYGLIEDALEAIIAAIKAGWPVVESVRLQLCKPEILSNCTVCVEKMSTY